MGGSGELWGWGQLWSREGGAEERGWWCLRGQAWAGRLGLVTFLSPPIPQFPFPAFPSSPPFPPFSPVFPPVFLPPPSLSPLPLFPPFPWLWVPSPSPVLCEAMMTFLCSGGEKGNLSRCWCCFLPVGLSPCYVVSSLGHGIAAASPQSCSSLPRCPCEDEAETFCPRVGPGAAP